MIKKINLLGLLLLLFTYSLLAQTQRSNSNKDLLREANVLLLQPVSAATSSKKEELIDQNMEYEKGNGDFMKALAVLQKALLQQPDDANINYKTGLCYYFSSDKQLQALPYFNKAVKRMSAAYDFSSTTECAAPYSALYFLASTYLEASKPDSALKYFSLYTDYTHSGNLNTGRETAICYNARDSDKHIRNVQVKNMGSVINTSYSEKNPVVSIDNTLLFFSSNRVDSSLHAKGSEDIFIAVKNTSGAWSAVTAFPFNTEYDEAPLFITVDGKTLYFRKTIKGNADIYSSNYSKGSWSKPKAFMEVNSAFNENGLSITANGKTVYFSSDRNREAGKFDLYQIRKEKNGSWGEIQRLSASVNSSFNEVSPFINPDGQTLFFSSDGYENKGTGGFDIYYSVMGKDHKWSIPQSMGFPVNSTRNDVNFYIAADNKRYYAKLNADKSYDLYQVNGAGFDFESFSAAEVVTLTQEMDVSQVLETEKEVEKEVEVTKTVETEVEVVKEVEVTKTVEGNINDLNLDNLSKEEQDALFQKVKEKLAAELMDKQSVSFKTVYFDINKSNLSLLSINELIVLVEFLNEHPGTKVEVIGNTDNTGSWQTNLNLSSSRAKEVYEFLLKNKVSPDRMYYYGRASAVPLVANDTEANRSKNRRVEVLILK